MNIPFLSLFQPSASQAASIEDSARHARSYDMQMPVGSGQPGVSREAVRAELARAMKSGLYPVNVEAFPQATRSSRTREEAVSEIQASASDKRFVALAREIYSA
jgi:hypothetical protein